jgi:uncharacterized membrane protein
MLTSLPLLVCLGAAIVAGVFFAFSSFVMKALGQLPPSQGIAAMQRINVVVLNPVFLGVFVGTAVLAGIAVFAGFFPWGAPRSLLLFAAGLAYLVGCFGVTVAFNVPRNERLARLEAESEPGLAYWPVYLREWTRWNHVRTAAAALGAASAAGALALGASTATAAPRGSLDACYVRAEPAAPADSPASAADGAASTARSHLGLRRRSEQLFEVEVSMTAAPDTTCTVAGVARLRGEPGAEALALVVRPDPGRKSGRSGTLCQVFFQMTAAGVEVRTTPAACQAQALCEGKVDLNGLRFDHAARLPAGAAGPCFEKKPAP